MTTAAPSQSGRRRLTLALTALCMTQIVGWGVLYYAFPVALSTITADTGWSTSAITAAFAVALLTSGAAGIPAGRLIDRYGPRPVMTCGSVAAAGALVAVALAPNLFWFWTAWILVGASMAGIFYQAAFAAITMLFRTGRNRALTILTLAGGLASTIFAPITHLLLEQLSWRDAYLVLAAVLAVITIPAHWLGLPTVHPTPNNEKSVSSTPSVRSILRSTAFLRATGGFTLAALGMYAASLTLIPLLLSRGMSAGLAAVTFGLLGAGQLLGRLAFAPLARSTTLPTRTLGIIGTGAILTAALAWTPGPAALLIVLSVFLGAARGAETLLQATLPADLWGPDRYATITGYFAAPITGAAAIAPWIGTTVSAHLTEQLAWTSFAVLIIGGALLVASSGPTLSQSTRPLPEITMARFTPPGWAVAGRSAPEEPSAAARTGRIVN